MPSMTLTTIVLRGGLVDSSEHDVDAVAVRMLLLRTTRREVVDQATLHWVPG